MELRRAALRRAVEVVAARGIDLERDRERRADLRAVDEDGLIQTVERESVARAQAVVGGREVDPHDFAALDVNFRWLVCFHACSRNAMTRSGLRTPGMLFASCRF